MNAGVGVLETNPDMTSDIDITPTNSIIRLALVAFGPIAINAGVAIMFFGMACCMGPVFSMCCKKFGAVLAGIAHAISVIALILFFEVMYFLEGWNFAKTLSGMIAVVAIQRFIYKLIVSLALTREFRADTSNIAWWTGKWYSLGWHTLSQPGREFLCKITEMGFFSADFVLGHILLFIMLPALCVPYIDKFHSVMLFWLRPSRQIRPPIYSLKQTKLRKRRVVRFAILYFTLFVLFMVLLIAPAVIGNLGLLDSTFEGLYGNKFMYLMQPSNWNNNDTTSSKTGSGLPNQAAQTAARESASSTRRAMLSF